MADKFFRNLTIGTRFNKDQIQTLKLNDLQKKAQLPEPSSKVDFFAENTQTPLGSEISVKKVLLKTKLAKTKTFKSIEDVNIFRKKQKIKVYGSDVPAPILTFEGMLRLGVPEGVAVLLKSVGFKKPTPVQQQAAPILAENRDAFIVAPTGSGKTVAFLLGIAAKLSKSHSDGNIRVVIVSPTRELAQQISQELKRFLKGSAFKAVYFNKALLNQWKSNAPKIYHDILITTPLRLIHGIRKKVVDLTGVQSIVLDEADKLLELGLMNQMDKILAACTSASVQKCLFSATIPTGVEDAAKTFMLDPVKVVIGVPNAAVKTVEQKLVYVGQEDGKLMAIRQMLQSGGEEGLMPPVIIFAETIDRAQALLTELRPLGIRIDCIHSARSQSDREKIIADFKAGSIWFLVTTELLARGLDFPNVNYVINYDFPPTTASYIHRIGRTARAGKSGRAITLFTNEDADSLRLVANVMRQSGCEVPEWMLQLKNRSSGQSKRAKKGALKEEKRLRKRREALFSSDKNH